MQITIEDDFHLEKIANSGQCFRVKRFENGMYRFICENRFIYIRHKEGSLYEADCSLENWHGFWYDYFDLGRNYRNIRKAIPPEDACLTEAALVGEGIRILRQNPWEMLITFIISQRKSIPAIKRAVELLSSGFGEPIHTEHETLYAFPAPHRLLNLSEDTLRQCGLGYRAPYIRDAITKVASGHIDLDQLHEYQDTDLLDTLKTVCGVGNKVANCISLFAYGRTALAPVDTWISRTIDEKYHGVNPFLQYGNAAGIMQQYIFYYAQTHKQNFAKTSGRKSHEKIHKYRRSIPLCALVLYLCLCLSMQIAPRDTALTEGDCQLYYIVNTDGMKGLGHSILLLVDADGAGTVFSFNGMQRSLGESLLGKAGVGKMSIGTMDAREVSLFLQTGNLELGEEQLTDNYDWALYRNITESDMECILERAKPYIQTEQDFETLYLQWAQSTDEAEKEQLYRELEAMSRDASLPLYQIYTNNCDHAARLLAASADRDMQTYSAHTWHMTPNGNLKAFSRRAPKWGAMELGENSVLENLLSFFMIF